MTRRLLIDIGNSRVKWVVKNGEACTPTIARIHRGHSLTDLLDKNFSLLSPPDQILVSCVSDAATQAALTHWIDVHWQLQPMYVVSSRQVAGVVNGYREPHTLGSDRWSAMIAAFHLVGGPVCIIDAGTALTIDVINMEGVHQGGMILPGIYSTQESLFSHIAVPVVKTEIMPMHQLLGNSTQECISLGIQHSFVGLFMHLFIHLKQQFGREPLCLVTGGDASTIAAWLPVMAQQDPDLVLKGLAVLAANN
jgi:type III pantothenate kinase